MKYDLLIVLILSAIFISCSTQKSDAEFIAEVVKYYKEQPSVSYDIDYKSNSFPLMIQ